MRARLLSIPSARQSVNASRPTSIITESTTVPSTASHAAATLVPSAPAVAESAAARLSAASMVPTCCSRWSSCRPPCSTNVAIETDRITSAGKRATTASTPAARMSGERRPGCESLSLRCASARPPSRPSSLPSLGGSDSVLVVDARRSLLHRATRRSTAEVSEATRRAAEGNRPPLRTPAANEQPIAARSNGFGCASGTGSAAKRKRRRRSLPAS